MTDLKELIEREIDQYLEWPTADKSHVTTVSAKLFAEHVAQLYADHLRDAGRGGVMATETMRAEFEWWASDEGEYPQAVERVGGCYKLAQIQSYWGAWQASRAALSIELPESYPRHRDSFIDVMDAELVVEAIEDAGVRVS